MTKPIWIEHARYARSIKKAAKNRRPAMIRKLLDRWVKTLLPSRGVDPLPGLSLRRDQDS